MSEEMLSAMLDGECSPAEVEQVLAAIAASPALQARWSRMCLARDALAGTRVRKPAFDICAGVMAALDNAPQDAAPKVVPLRQPAAPSAQPAPMRRRQPLIALAAAASIAAAVVVVGRGQLLQQPGAPAQTVAVVKPASLLVPVAATDEPVETRWTQLDAATARQLDDYLMEHSNSRAETGMGGALSYARLAVRAADYRPAAEQR